jgi:hypothetical protein
MYNAEEDYPGQTLAQTDIYEAELVSRQKKMSAVSITLICIGSVVALLIAPGRFLMAFVVFGGLALGRRLLR